MAKNLRDYVGLIVKKVAEQAAREITYDLKREGPYWTGDFEKAWVVRPGDVSIAKEGEARDLSNGIPERKSPSYTEAEIPDVQPASKAVLTIGNTSPYREIAMDLLPDKPRLFREDGSRKNNTAEPDWYVMYAQGKGLRDSAKKAIKLVQKDPSIKNFKGSFEVRQSQ